MSRGRASSKNDNLKAIALGPHKLNEFYFLLGRKILTTAIKAIMFRCA
jgi:hypothetical protein